MLESTTLARSHWQKIRTKLSGFLLGEKSESSCCLDTRTLSKDGQQSQTQLKDMCERSKLAFQRATCCCLIILIFFLKCSQMRQLLLTLRARFEIPRPLVRPAGRQLVAGGVPTSSSSSPPSSSSLGQSRPTAGKAQQDCGAKIQIKRVPFGVLLTSHFAPSALSSDED